MKMFRYLKNVNRKCTSGLSLFAKKETKLVEEKSDKDKLQYVKVWCTKKILTKNSTVCDPFLNANTTYFGVEETPHILLSHDLFSIFDFLDIWVAFILWSSLKAKICKLNLNLKLNLAFLVISLILFNRSHNLKVYINLLIGVACTFFSYFFICK